LHCTIARPFSAPDFPIPIQIFRPAFANLSEIMNVKWLERIAQPVPTGMHLILRIVLAQKLYTLVSNLSVTNEIMAHHWVCTNPRGDEHRSSKMLDSEGHQVQKTLFSTRKTRSTLAEARALELSWSDAKARVCRMTEELR
jgi:hypothetical protein